MSALPRRLQAQMGGNALASAGPHPAIDALGVVHDFRDRAVEAEETVRQVERVAGLGKRAHAAHQVRAAASDHDVERRWAMTTEMLPQRIAHGAEGLIDIGVVRFAPDDEKDVGLLEPMLVTDARHHLPKLWELVHHYGMTTLELNPILMRRGREGRLTPVACDFKCGFDRDDPRWQRLALPDHLFTADTSEFEHEVNQLRTHQGQSDVFVINPHGTILAPTFGGGANSLVTQVLGEAAIISSDFGGNPPYEKMKEVARICYKHWLKQANVLFIIGGKSNNTDIYETFRAMGDALREHFSRHGPSPLYVVVGRGGPNLVRGMGALAETCDSLNLPYRFFGFDSAISEVVNYAKSIDGWMRAGGRKRIAAHLGLQPAGERAHVHEGLHVLSR